jgi:streptogramin lyase
MIASARSTTHRGWNTRTRVPLTLSVAVIALVTGTLSTASASGAHRGAAPGKTRISYFFVSSLHSRPWRITPGPDGNLWFTDTDPDMIGTITPDGQITEYPIGDGKVPYDIVAGRDGNLWFTENVNDKTGAVNTSGQLVHEYYAPGVDARPTGITVAPNGDIWWVDGGSGQEAENNVSHLTKNGEVINHELFPCACFGIGLTTGPDGKLWAVEELGVADEEAKGTVDKISKNGTKVKRYGIPAPPFSDQHLPAWDAAGPDGRVWFTELSLTQHAVGAVTDKGKIVEYGLPGSASNTGSITTGIDGNLWVTEPDANRVTVLRPDGSFVKSYKVHQEPMGITIGPDGNMWFANALSGEIGRIPTAAPNTGYVLDVAPGFVPAERTIALGDTVQWVLEAPGDHRIADETGLVMYDSGHRSPVSFFAHTFGFAGTWGYMDTINGDTASIGVPVDAPATAAVGSRIPVTWATQAPPTGLFFDVQYLPPGGSHWVTWKNGVTSQSGSLLASGVGTYQFRARMRDQGHTAGPDWSPPASVVVS